MRYNIIVKKYKFLYKSKYYLLIIKLIRSTTSRISNDVSLLMSEAINCSLVAGGPAALRCKMTKITKLSGKENFTIFGELVAKHESIISTKDT